MIPHFAAQPAALSSHDLLTFFSSGFASGGPTAPGGYAEVTPPPPQKSNIWLWILGGCGCSVVLLLVCCGGFSWWGFSTGTQFLANTLRQEIAGNADVEENLGEVNSLTTNFTESAREKQARGGTTNWLVFDAVGTKSSGKFIVEQSPVPQQGNFFSKIELRLPDGKTVQIK